MSGLLPTLVVLLLPVLAYAQIRVEPGARPQVVFANGESSITIPLTNSGEQAMESALSVRLLQIAGTVAAPLGGSRPWKKAELRAGQTVVEKLGIALPEVRVATRFRVEIWNEESRSIGRVEVIGCPPGILKRLGELGGEQGPALYDPDQVLAPAFRAAGASLMEMDRGEALAGFTGRLAIVDLSGKDAPLEAWRIAALEAAKRGVAVILLLPADAAVRASGFLGLDGHVTIETRAAGRVAFLQRVTAEPLATSAAAQFALVQLAESLLDPPDGLRPGAP